MNLSPGTRSVLTAIAAAIAAGGGVLVHTDGVADWVGVVVAVCGAVFGALGIVPPAVGGTQQGVVNPSLQEPPPVD